jgi:Uma2 family endonuclease
MSLTTAQALFESVADGYRYELVKGQLTMMSPAGGRHGRIAMQVAYLLKDHLKGRSLGVVFAAETGFLIQTDPDTVLAPDVAYVSSSRFEAVENENQYLPLAPELAAEVLSPSDRFSRVESKAFAWLDAGTQLVLLIDPENETIHAYRSRKQIEVFEQGESIDCTNAVPGWSLAVNDVFRLY